MSCLYLVRKNKSFLCAVVSDLRERKKIMHIHRHTRAPTAVSLADWMVDGWSCYYIASSRVWFAG